MGHQIKEITAITRHRFLVNISRNVSGVMFSLSEFSFHLTSQSICLVYSSVFRHSFFFFLPLHRRVVEMQQRCAVLAAIKADADFLRGIPIQRRLDCFQRRRNFLAQRCACREGYPPREIIQKCRCVLYYRCFRYRPFHLNRGFHLV